jgi:SAM-dependent methyltransferase
VSGDDRARVGEGRQDASNGYEAVASEFIAGRSRSAVGVATVRAWCTDLPRGATVLDLGCGPGVPITQALLDTGLSVYGIDASPSMIAALRARFPNVPAECAAVEHSRFFGRTFDGVVAWGLLFLLAPEAQTALIRKVAAALAPGGRLLFTAPRQPCHWIDNLTGLRSVSLGAEAYRRALEQAGVAVTGETDDEGENHYYFGHKTGSPETERPGVA